MNEFENPFTVFDFKFSDEKLQQVVIDFFQREQLQPLFTNEHRSTPISVSWIEARNIEKKGSYYQKIAQIQELLMYAQGNKKYEQAVFKMIYESKTIQKLANISERATKLFIEITDKQEDNFWNIVFYTKEVY